MKKKNDPAFPMVFNDCPSASYTGLTIRQYLAAKAIGTCMSIMTKRYEAAENGDIIAVHEATRLSFDIADEMIAFEENEKK